MSSAVFVALLFCVAAVSGQTIASDCSAITPKANFDSSRFAGQWFGVHALVQGNEGIDWSTTEMKCLKENIQANAEGQLTVEYEFTKTSTNQKITRTSVGVPVNNVRSKLAFTSGAHPGVSDDSTVLDTDYDNFAIWVACLNRNGIQGLVALVSSRQATLNQDLLNRVRQTLRDNNLSDTFQAIDQQGC